MNNKLLKCLALGGLAIGLASCTTTPSSTTPASTPNPTTPATSTPVTPSTPAPVSTPTPISTPAPVSTPTPVTSTTVPVSTPAPISSTIPPAPVASYDISYNFSSAEVGTYDAETQFGDFTLLTDASHSVTIEELEAPVEIDGLTFTKRLNTKGSANMNTPYRVYKFTSTGKGTIDIYGKSGKAGEARDIGVYNTVKKLDEDSVSLGDDIQKYTLEINFITDYYIYSAASLHIHFIGINMEEGVENTDWAPTNPEHLTDANFLNANELIAQEYKEGFTMDNFTVNATSDENCSVVVDANSKERSTQYNGITVKYTKRIKLGGAGAMNYRSITVDMAGAGYISIDALSSNSSTPTQIMLYKADGTAVTAEPVVFAGKNPNNDKQTITQSLRVEEAGKYTFYVVPATTGDTKGINVYGVIINLDAAA